MTWKSIIRCKVQCIVGVVCEELDVDVAVTWQCIEPQNVRSIEDALTPTCHLELLQRVKRFHIQHLLFLLCVCQAGPIVDGLNVLQEPNQNLIT